MKLNRPKRRGTIMVIAYGLMAVYYLLMITRPHGPQRNIKAKDYYSPTAALTIGQCGPNGCSVPMSGSYSSGSYSGDSWSVPSTPTEGWVYKRGGVEVGRVNRDGTTTGFVQAQPGWYPSDMPQQFQRATQAGQLPGQRVTGELPPDGGMVFGQDKDKPTGVDKDKVAIDKARIPSGISINGQPQSEALVRDRLSDSAKAQGFKDFGDAMRLVVVGHSEAERKAFVAIAKPVADASEGKLIIQECDDGDWHVRAHTNAMKNAPDYEPGKPFAFLQRPKGTALAIMYTPSEVAQVIKQHRPEVAPNFDASKARALTQASDSWMFWASGAFVAFFGLIGAVTYKPQQ